MRHPTHYPEPRPFLRGVSHLITFSIPFGIFINLFAAYWLLRIISEIWSLFF